MIQCNAYPLEIERTAFMQTRVKKWTRTAGTGTALFFAGIIKDSQKYKYSKLQFWPFLDGKARHPHRMAPL